MNNAQLINPIGRWNHRLPSLVAATVVTGILLAAISALASSEAQSVQSPLAAASQSKVAG